MKILAYRFSAFGDVAMTVPAIRSVIEANPEVEITFVSRKVFEPLFYGIPRFRFYPIDLDEYKGLFGLQRLFKELNGIQKWDFILDLHSVMRTWILNSFFRVSGHRVHGLNKGRGEKQVLTRKKDKILAPLKHSTERTLDVFRSTGLDVSLKFEKSILSNPSDQNQKSLDVFLENRQLVKTSPWIAIAPFSIHKQKEWALDRIQELIQALSKRGYSMFLFGAGEKEENKLKELEAAYNNTFNLAGVLTLEQEMLLLNKIDVMVSMDSFNMHLASLMGVQVVSIWGATHSFAGFGPLGPSANLIVQRDDLTCRPCSVFGNKACFRKDLACLDIQTAKVLEQIEIVLS